MGDLEERNKSVVRRFAEAVNGHNLEVVEELVAPDFVRHCEATPGLEIRNLDAFKTFLEEDWAGVPDGHAVARFLIAEGDLVAFYCTFTGTQTGPWGPLPPSGRRVEFDYSGVTRVAAGKIQELWITWDNMAILSQLRPQPGG